MMLPALYAATATLAAPGLRAMLARRAARGKEIRARLNERRGIDAAPRPAGKLMWLHAASVGETVSMLPVLPHLDAPVLVTTGTVTSANLLARRLPELGLADRVMHRFVPLDVPAWVARFLTHWRPDAAAFVESEIWPNLLAGCATRRVPLMLVNARLSAHSFSRWKFVPGLARHLFGSFAIVQAQSEADGARVHALGGPCSALTGNLKFSAGPLPVDAVELERLERIIDGRPTWLAASTHPSEEPIVLAVHALLAPRHPDLVTIIVPRHPERGPAISAQAGAIAATRRSRGDGPPSGAGVWIADTLGELGLFYRLAGTAFVGKSLGNARGGQNVLEPARLGCAIAAGPEVQNFADPVAVLQAAGALACVSNTDTLAQWVEAMLADPARRAAMAEAGIAASSRFADLPRQVAELLTSLLH